MTRITAGPYTLDIPPNGRATLYEADPGGDDHEQPWGVGTFEALIQFAGEVARLRAALASSQDERRDHNLCLSGVASNEPCQPDDTLRRCTICGFIIDTKYKAEFSSP